MKWLFYISFFCSVSALAQSFEGKRIVELPSPVQKESGLVDYLIEESALPDYSIRTVKTHSSLLPKIRLVRYEDQTKNNVKLNLLSDFNYFHSSTTNYPFGGYRTGIGAEVNSLINNKWHLRASAVQGVHETDPQFSPKSYFSWRNGKTNWYTDVRARFSYTPNHIFNFQAGLDHNFIGQGSRSLFLNDYGKPYPFGLMRARFWRLEYSILYQFMREGEHQNWEGKFASSHHISFNAAKWLNIGIFETVVFQPKDTLLNRGFDAEYLNPFVFYRPQEYSLGSSDNVLMGIEATGYHKQMTFYGQFIIDEFVLDEIRGRTGWWANKYGGQIGVKGRKKHGRNFFFYRAEVNFIRPYTYAHLSDDLNYGNQGMPLAHIYGANFAEVLGEIKWRRKQFGANLFTNYSLHGSDQNGYNYGADIYTPYINRPYEKGHFIGHGRQLNLWRAQLTGTYEITRHGKLRAFVENNFAYNVQDRKMNYTLVVGLRSVLWNDYRNY